MAFKGTRQLRKGRYSEENHIYFVTAVVGGRTPVFGDFRVGRLLVSALRYEASIGDLNSLAFVVMPDHFHWLIQLNRNGNSAQGGTRAECW